jgi:hypothetical protein
MREDRLKKISEMKVAGIAARAVKDGNSIRSNSRRMAVK